MLKLKKKIAVGALVFLGLGNGITAVVDDGQTVLLNYPAGSSIFIGDVFGGDGLVDNLILKTRDEERARIDQNGQLGIGRVPERMVDVAGTMRATAIEGNGVFPV